MRHSLLTLVLLVFVLPGAAWASDPIRKYVPEAAIVGQGVLTFAFWDVYTATLYAPKGKWAMNRPFALSIRYMRDLDGKAIADTSAQEMERQGFTDAAQLKLWQDQMTQIFPNVTEGTVLTAAYIPNRKTVFYEGTHKIGEVKGEPFGRRFFGIWLQETTAKPALRRDLLGL
jgi:hypothetical protein